MVNRKGFERRELRQRKREELDEEEMENVR